MKTKRVIGVVLAGGLLCLAGVLAPIGCESTKTTDNAITVTPASSTLTNAGSVVTLTASLTGTNGALALPLVWTVSHDLLGHIRASAGVTAIYESFGHNGNNVITVHDQGDNEGVAVISQ